LILFGEYVSLFFLLFCSFSVFWTYFVANLCSLIDEFGFSLGKGEKTSFLIEKEKKC